MPTSDHFTEFHGLPVLEFPGPGVAIEADREVAWRIAADPWDEREDDETWTETFARFRAQVDTTTVRALVVGAWFNEDEGCDLDSAEVIAALVAAADELPALRALFIGDITSEENEISWIQQSDVSPLLRAFPALTELGIRSGEALVFPPVTHTALRSLTIQTGGLDAEVVRGVAASDLPALEELELWLGTTWYGATSTIDDLAPLLAGTRLPNLRILRLRNSDMQDEVAAALAAAPVVARLEVLDLSMGVLSDLGAAALLDGQPLDHLRRLDLHHHYLSDAMAARIATALGEFDVEVDLSEPAGSSSGIEDRFVAIGE